MSIKTKKNSYIRTYTGRKVHPLVPLYKEICIEDIAHALSQICRFTGHTKFFYSVAQHCCYAFDLASKENKLAALMHDSSEAYFADISSPVKPYLENYKKIEWGLEVIIAKKFNYQFPYPLEVKNEKTNIDIDKKLLNTELKQLMDSTDFNKNMCYPFTIRYWSPNRAKKEFLKRFNLIYGKRK